ncbi:MAG TPA: hypothetical protein VFK08_07260 [Rhodanobacteraceae bacterium]|jgi:hypothetical protein|nr:hypothetical protein [Rhodanobacteraceae bacterium]
MARVSFIPWLLGRADGMVVRCAELLQQRRMRRAQSLLPHAVRENAKFWRALYLARNARLQREREARRQARARSPGSGLPADISKADVLAAIARSRANREARLKAARDEEKG